MGKLFPQWRQLKFPGGYVLSFRWRSYGYDVVKSEYYRLVQFGRKGRPLKFLCHIAKTAPKPPMFLYSSRWQHHYTSTSLVAGETTKPFNIAKLWGK
jgi:hypothetical protein